MYKYNSFEEFIQLNYFDEIKEAVSSFIGENMMEVKFKRKKKTYESFDISDIRVTFVDWTKSRNDHVEFDVYLRVKYLLIDEVYDEKSVFPPILEAKDVFIYPMEGSFKEGFKKRKKKMSKTEEEQPESISTSLVPVVHVEELDDYATKFLQFYCPEALKEPTRLDLREILSKNGMDYFYAPLDEEVFGMTYFAKDKAIVYESNDETEIEWLDLTKEVEVKPGTILVNYHKHKDRPEGVERNTIIHECVHWFFHRNYFELRQCLNEEDTAVICYKGNHTYENTDIEWMEWQARALAPRILMPRDMALQKYEELLEEAEEMEMSQFEETEWILEQFAEFFGASLKSAQIRLKELGLSKFDGIKNFVDGGYIDPFSFQDGFLQRGQTFIVNAEELSKLLITNVFIRDSLSAEKILYINKMLVINNPKFVDYENYCLTDYAKENVHECALVFNIRRFFFDENGELQKLSFLASSVNGKKEIKELDGEQLQNIIALAKESGSHFEKHKAKLPTTFGETLEYHYKCAKKNGIVNSYSDLEFESDVSERTIRNYRDGKTKPSRENIIKLALALRLSAPYIKDLLEKGDQAITYNGTDNTMLLAVIHSYQRVGLEQIYLALKQNDTDYLLNLSATYIHNHGLDGPEFIVED